MKKKANTGKILGIIFCFVMTAVIFVILFITADLRSCQKTLDKYFGGISKGNYSNVISAYIPLKQSELKKITDIGEQNDYLEEHFGNLISTKDKGVRISYKINSFNSLDADTDFQNDAEELKEINITLKCKSEDFDNEKITTFIMFKIDGKWYLSEDLL